MITSAAATLSVNTTYFDDNYQWQLPAHSGKIPVTGTFTVQLPAVSALDIYSTNVAVTGLRAEDALVASIQNMSTTGIGTRGFVFLAGITPANGFAHLTFMNPTATATIYTPFVVAYAIAR